MVKSSKNSIPSQRIQCYKINIPLYSNNNKRIMVVQIAITKKDLFLTTNKKNTQIIVAYTDDEESISRMVRKSHWVNIDASHLVAKHKNHFVVSTQFIFQSFVYLSPFLSFVLSPIVCGWFFDSCIANCILMWMCLCGLLFISVFLCEATNSRIFQRFSCILHTVRVWFHINVVSYMSNIKNNCIHALKVQLWWCPSSQGISTSL